MPRPDTRLLVNPPEWWEAAEKAAEKAGVTLSKWVGEAIWNALPLKVRKTLPARPDRGRKPISDNPK